MPGWRVKENDYNRLKGRKGHETKEDCGMLADEIVLSENWEQLVHLLLISDMQVL